MKLNTAFLYVEVSLLLISCSPKNHSSEEERLKWNMATVAGVYDQFGQKDPKWDSDAKVALIAYAKIRSDSDLAADERAELIGDAAKNAVDAGCNDPMVKYLYCRYGSFESIAESQREFRAMAESMEGSPYPPIRKFYANLRASNVLWEDRNTNLWHEVHNFRMAAISDLAGALQEKAMPVEEAYQASLLLIQSTISSTYQLTNAYFAIEAPLFKNWPHAAAPYIVKGEFYYEFAWKARGGGYAQNVSEDRWKLFFARLEKSEDALNKAWSLDSHNPEIPTVMIKVAEGRQEKRPEMERWFQRAMQLDTNNYDACYNKLHYLLPQWYGSREDMLNFGRECVASTNWGGRVPLILVDAHDDCYTYLRGRQQRELYWTLPDVWPDIKASYEKFFQLNPKAEGYRSYYARYALRCGQWKDFAGQIKILRAGDEELDYDFFGGRKTFDAAMKLAKQNPDSH